MVIGFIQARIGSTRLPGKVLVPIAGEPMLWHLWWRLSQSREVDQVVVATGDDPRNQEIVSFCASRAIPCFVGSEERVLDRIHAGAKMLGADVIVSVTGDCPLVDPAVAERVVRELREYGPDLCTTSPSFTFPDGFGVEAFPLRVLEQAHADATDPMEREHLMLHVRRRRGTFSIRFVEHWSYHPFTDAHLSVDDEHDLTLVRRIFEALSQRNPLFGIDDVITVLGNHPEWIAEHPGTPVNEGYFKGLLAQPPVISRPRAVGLVRANALLARVEYDPCVTPEGSAVVIGRADGGVIHDQDDNEFIDTILGRGAISVGHSHPEVQNAVMQMERGASELARHRLEAELADRLCEIIPGAEHVRFWKSRSDAIAAAIGVARNVTGRDTLLCCDHGTGQDWHEARRRTAATLQASSEQPIHRFPYGDLETLKSRFAEHGSQVAAVIMEPVASEPPPDGYLRTIRELAHRHGAILVFDETTTGFRICPGGAEAYFGVIPDLACFNKGLGNGYPLAAIVGRRDIVKEFDRGFASSGGDVVGLAAALAAMEVLDRESGVSQMWIFGRKLKDAYNYLARRHGLIGRTSCHGFPPLTAISFAAHGGGEGADYGSLFRQECLRRGVLFNAAPRFCLSHTDAQVEKVIAVFDEAFSVLAGAYARGGPDAVVLGEHIG